MPLDKFHDIGESLMASPCFLFSSIRACFVWTYEAHDLIFPKLYFNKIFLLRVCFGMLKKSFVFPRHPVPEKKLKVRHWNIFVIFFYQMLKSKAIEMKHTRVCAPVKKTTEWTRRVEENRPYGGIWVEEPSRKRKIEAHRVFNPSQHRSYEMIWTFGTTSAFTSLSSQVLWFLL